MVYLDANIILRYILCDNEVQAESARKLIYGGNCIAKNEVLAEVVYVLNKVYGIERSEIKTALDECLKKLLAENKAVMQNALALYALRTFDFVDCILASQAVVAGDDVRTFDKKLQNYIEKAKA